MMGGVEGNDAKEKTEKTVANNSIIVEVEFSENKIISILQTAYLERAEYIEKVEYFPTEFKSTNPNIDTMYDVLFNCTTQRGQWAVKCSDDDTVYWLSKDSLERAIKLLLQDSARNFGIILGESNVFDKAEYKDICDDFLQFALFGSIKY